MKIYTKGQKPNILPILTIDKSDLINLNMEVHEIYFNETIEGNNTEQFYLKVEKRKGNKKFKLIRKIQRENHFIKTITKISMAKKLSQKLLKLKIKN